MEWYKKLTIIQKINFKEAYPLFMDVEFEKLASFFSFKERIEMGYNKLKMEGFDVHITCI